MYAESGQTRGTSSITLCSKSSRKAYLSYRWKVRKDLVRTQGSIHKNSYHQCCYRSVHSHPSLHRTHQYLGGVRVRVRGGEGEERGRSSNTLRNFPIKILL